MATRAGAHARGAPRARLHVVEGRKRGPRRRSPVAVVILVVLTVFGVAAIQAVVGQDGLEAAKLERYVNQESERHALLQARVAQLSNASRVADEAEKLGLVGFPHPKRIEVPASDVSPFRRTGLPDGAHAVTAEGYARR